MTETNFLDLFFQPALATHQQKIDILIGLAASVSGDDERMSAFGNPVAKATWNRLRSGDD